ncbi:Aminotran_1_2 domain-containing protein [Psidium guajava]|nr:Aminotran_1_2 domain-containing protein [Psidium guajava]
MAGTFGAIVLDYLEKYPRESTIKLYSVLPAGASLNQEKSHKLFRDMAKNSRATASTVLLCLILVSALVPASDCFERPAPVRLIKCGACKKFAEQLYL